jgi:hypothetical protein
MAQIKNLILSKVGIINIFDRIRIGIRIQLMGWIRIRIKKTADPKRCFKLMWSFGDVKITNSITWFFSC